MPCAARWATSRSSTCCAPGWPFTGTAPSPRTTSWRTSPAPATTRSRPSVPGSSRPPYRHRDEVVHLRAVTFTSVAEEHRERELKFDVGEGWQLPPLDALLPHGGSVEQETVNLTSTYFDTGEHDLLRARFTLRRRTGDTDTGWHLKVPAGDTRLEIRYPLDGAHDEVPAELAALTLGVRGGASLDPIATITTERAVHRLLDADGRPLAELVVDEVHGVAGGEAAVVSRWREVEVELADGDEELLGRAADLLNGAGAQPAAAASKLARALGHPAPAPPDLEGLAGLVGRYLDAQYEQLIGNDVELRRGNNVVHGTRTASRRYRSILRVFADIMDADQAAALDTEIAWYAGVLGQLRDRHVLRDHLDAALAELPPELNLGPVANRIHHLLDVDLAEAQAELDEAMAGERYFALLRDLRAWHEQPPLRAERPAADAADYLRGARRKVRRRLKSAKEAPDRDTAMHRARKAAKRLRYTAELSEPELGASAEKARRRAKKVQERLGQRQDSVVAADFLLWAGRVAGTTPGENGFTFGLLYQRERDTAFRLDG